MDKRMRYGGPIDMDICYPAIRFFLCFSKTVAIDSLSKTIYLHCGVGVVAKLSIGIENTNQNQNGKNEMKEGD